MMTPDERATLAASDHYARRLRQLDERVRTLRAVNIDPSVSADALRMIERARSAELRDPAPSPYTP